MTSRESQVKVCFGCTYDPEYSNVSFDDLHKLIQTVESAIVHYNPEKWSELIHKEYEQLRKQYNHFPLSEWSKKEVEEHIKYHLKTQKKIN